MLAIMAAMQLAMQITNLTRDFGLSHSGVVYYLSSVSWMMIPTWSILLLLYVLDVSRYLLWYRKAKKRAEEGLMTPSVNSRWGQGLALWLLTGLVLSWVTTGALTGFMLLFFGAMAVAGVLAVLASKWMKRMKVSAKVNELLTCGIAVVLMLAFMVTLMPTMIGSGGAEDGESDNVPLRLEDIGYAAAAGRVNMDTQSSPLVVRTYVWQWLECPQELVELEYIVADVHVKLLWDACVADFLKNGAQSVEAAPWQADAAWKVQERFSSEDFVYVLYWGDRLVWLNLEQEPSDGQKSVISEKLRP
jgi:hypothetical protein